MKAMISQPMAGKKDEADIDLGKVNNYAHRLVSGEWRDHG